MSDEREEDRSYVLREGDSVRITKQQDGSLRVSRERREWYGKTWADADNLQRGKRRYR